jgi:hypothetical protein
MGLLTNYNKVYIFLRSHSSEQLRKQGGAAMKKKVIFVCALLCIAGIAFIAGCTGDTTTGETPTPTPTEMATSDVTPGATETPGLGTPEGTTTAEATPTPTY